jgi:hypothetical protein
MSAIFAARLSKERLSVNGKELQKHPETGFGLASSVGVFKCQQAPV